MDGDLFILILSSHTRMHVISKIQRAKAYFSLIAMHDSYVYNFCWQNKGGGGTFIYGVKIIPNNWGSSVVRIKIRSEIIGKY